MSPQKSHINVQLLRSLYLKHKRKLDILTIFTIETTLKTLEQGAAPKLTKDLASISMENSMSIVAEGAHFTDTLSSWISRGFVLGPFDNPPFDNLRINRILGVRQQTKVRPIMDLSAPEGNSFNEAVDKDTLRKIKTFSAKDFAEGLHDLGKDAVFAKLDWTEAYKNIHVNDEYLKYQAFKWLGKTFIETRLVFGAVNAVSDYDNLAHAVNELAKKEARTPRVKVYRVIDDVPSMGSASKGEIHRYLDTYIELCKSLNIELAPFSVDRVKAFGLGTSGVVLGIHFDAKSMTWSLPKDKALRYISSITEILEKGSINLEQLQKIMGALEHVCSVCPILRAFRHNAYRLLAKFEGNDRLTVRLERSIREDMVIWMNALTSSISGLPIAPRRGWPGPSAIAFLSDAAGASRLRDHDLIGVASVQTDPRLESSRPLARLWWPLNFISKAKDGKGAEFGSKSTTLEVIGLLIPALHCPHLLRDKEVILFVDNEAVVYGFKKLYVKRDLEASIFIRSLAIIEVKLNCRFFVLHAPRRASKPAIDADNLSRAATSADYAKIPQIQAQNLRDWFKDPKADWSLQTKLLQDVESALTPNPTFSSPCHP